jgi:transcriptional regulator with XRE-family HTH domain
MDTLANMIERAMAERGMDAPAVAKASGLTKQSVYNVLNGTTQWDKIRAVTLFALARALGTREALTLYTGSPEELLGSSHSLGIDADTLVEAEKLVAIEERIKGADYPPEQRMRRVAQVYEKVAADGGRLSRQHQDDFIRDAQQAGETGDGHHKGAATSRKAVSKR